MKTIKINIQKEAGDFAENKDIAKKLRTEIIIPNLFKDNVVEIDFVGVSGVTQSFIHALIAEPIRKFKNKALEKLFYRNCMDNVKEIIKTVYEYLQESMENENVK